MAQPDRGRLRRPLVGRRRPRAEEAGGTGRRSRGDEPASGLHRRIGALPSVARRPSGDHLARGSRGLPVRAGGGEPLRGRSAGPAWRDGAWKRAVWPASRPRPLHRSSPCGLRYNLPLFHPVIYRWFHTSFRPTFERPGPGDNRASVTGRRASSPSSDHPAAGLVLRPWSAPGLPHHAIRGEPADQSRVARSPPRRATPEYAALPVPASRRRDLGGAGPTVPPRTAFLPR